MTRSYGWVCHYCGCPIGLWQPRRVDGGKNYHTQCWDEYQEDSEKERRIEWERERTAQLGEE